MTSTLSAVATCPQCDAIVANAGIARVTEIGGIRTVERGTRLYCTNDRSHDLDQTLLAADFYAA
ncbi:MAG: hypothetical protein GEU74_17050 [Nitriliruptorales bacterium]|nr:hypothetical protein [Nitriliruptorales bacterium]